MGLTTTQSMGFRPADYLTPPLRLALGLSFLFAVADRLGMLGPPGTPGVSWGSFANFLAYNAQVNSFAPAATLYFLAVAATFFETIFGLGLVLGIATRLVAIGSGVLLFFLRNGHGCFLRDQVAFRLLGLFSDGRCSAAWSMGALSV